MSDADQPVASSGGAPKAAELSAERSEAHNVRATATTGPQLVLLFSSMLPVGRSVAVGPGLNTSSERRQNKRFWRGAFYAATFTFDERSAKNDEEAKKSSAPLVHSFLRSRLIPPSPCYKARQSHFLLAHRSPQNHRKIYVCFFIYLYSSLFNVSPIQINDVFAVLLLHS